MDEGFGYKNWGSVPDDDNSFDTSTPPTYTSETYGFGAGAKKRSKSVANTGKTHNDVYDFDYSDSVTDDKSQSRVMRRSSELSVKQSRRVSTDVRTKQILDKVVSERTIQRTKPAKDDSEVFSSFQDSWNELMQDLESVPGSQSPSIACSTNTSPRSASPLTPGMSDGNGTPRRSTKWTPDKNSPMHSASDSFEINAADFEVLYVLL